MHFLGNPLGTSPHTEDGTQRKLDSSGLKARSASQQQSAHDEQACHKGGFELRQGRKQLSISATRATPN